MVEVQLAVLGSGGLTDCAEGVLAIYLSVLGYIWAFTYLC